MGAPATTQSWDLAPILPRDEDEEARGHLLLELAARITGTLDLQEVLDASLLAMRRLVDFGGGAIQLIDDGALVAAATDPPMAPEARTVRIPVGQGVSGTIAATGEPIYISDIAVDERVHPDGRKAGVSNGVRSYFGVPLISAGRPIGVLQIDGPHIDQFDARIRALVLSFTPTIAAAVQNARLVENERLARQRLEELEALKIDFVSVVSHELRTPLTMLLGFSDTLAGRAHELSQDQVADYAGRAAAAGRRLESLINDLLYASRLEKGFLDDKVESVDVQGLIEGLLGKEGRLPTNLVVDIEAGLPPVAANGDHLRQVLSHLLDNAAKFSGPDQPIELACRLGPEPSGRPAVHLEVSDRGRGIDAQAHDAVFDLFFQAEGHSQRTAGGLGIGLYVVKRLCDSMGVEVAVAERDGGGTSFTLTFDTVEPA